MVLSSSYVKIQTPWISSSVSVVFIKCQASNSLSRQTSILSMVRLYLCGVRTLRLLLIGVQTLVWTVQDKSWTPITRQEKIDKVLPIRRTH